MTADNTSVISNSASGMPINPSSIVQILEAILVELKQLNFFIKQLPLYLNSGKNILDEDADYSENLTGDDITNNASLS